MKKWQYLLYKHLLLHGLNASLAADGGPRHVQTYKLSDYLFGAEDDPAILSSIPLAEDGVDAPLAVPEG